MLLGDRCTRTCGFCAISHASPGALDPEEPQRVADAARKMHLDYVVLTSVTRDDLPDGGSDHFAKTIRKIRESMPDARVEVLIPDFLGNRESIRKILDARPDVLNHNIETVASLYWRVRPQASYERSLALLHQASLDGGGIITKSGMMLGLGETDDEIMKTLKDLRAINCSLLTIGQYLQPSKQHLPVHRFVSPETFEMWRKNAQHIGFLRVESGPFVRSSYHAAEMQHEDAVPDTVFDN